ncbi:hypothetical protein D6825_00090 [Candidatus Woesearchaeota archaeon]|nr:MAG: hypothetical protein D6825_00090 [Candidatus Woesearchaeota archaeon]
MDWFSPMWSPYNGSEVSDLLRKHSEGTYRLAPYSIFGWYPLGRAKVYAGVFDGKVILQVGDKSPHHFFGLSAILNNMRSGKKRENREELRRYARIDCESVLNASMFRVPSKHHSAFGCIKQYLAFAFGVCTEGYLDEKIERKDLLGASCKVPSGSEKGNQREYVRQLDLRPLF